MKRLKRIDDDVTLLDVIDFIHKWESENMKLEPFLSSSMEAKDAVCHANTCLRNALQVRFGR